MPQADTTMSTADQIEFDCCGDPGCRCDTCPEQRRANILRSQSNTTLKRLSPDKIACLRAIFDAISSERSLASHIANATDPATWSRYGAKEIDNDAV
jgi:hypothetical protein